MQFLIHLKCLTYLLDFVADIAASQKSRIQLKAVIFGESNNNVILLLSKSKCKSNMVRLLHSNM